MNVKVVLWIDPDVVENIEKRNNCSIDDWVQGLVDYEIDENGYNETEDECEDYIDDAY